MKTVMPRLGSKHEREHHQFYRRAGVIQYPEEVPKGSFFDIYALIRFLK